MNLPFIRRGIAILAILATLAAFTAPLQADVGVRPRSVTLTNLPTFLPASFTTNLNTGIFPLYPGRGFALWPKFNSTNGQVNSGLTFTLDVSVDATNWSTQAPLNAFFAHNGTTNVLGYTNFPFNTVDNAAWGRVRTIANGNTNNCFLSNVVVTITP